MATYGPWLAVRGSAGKDDLPVRVCDTCGALVLATKTTQHDTWHQQMPDN